jgi:hypothetical protein
MERGFTTARDIGLSHRDSVALAGKR